MQKLQTWFDRAAGWSSREVHLAWGALFLLFGGFIATTADEPLDWAVVGVNGLVVVLRLALAANTRPGLISGD